MNENPPVPIPESGSVSLEPIPADIGLTSAAQQYLNQTGPWIRFFSILLFICSGLMLLTGAILILSGLAGISTPGGSMGEGLAPGGIGAALVGPIYGLMSILVYIVPAIFLFRYAGAIKMLRSSRSALALEDALRHQKSFWRYLGILTIILLVLAVLVIVAAVFFAAFLAMRRQSA